MFILIVQGSAIPTFLRQSFCRVFKYYSASVDCLCKIVVPSVQSNDVDANVFIDLSKVIPFLSQNSDDFILSQTIKRGKKGIMPLIITYSPGYSLQRMPNSVET